MKKFFKRTMSLVLSLMLLISVFAGCQKKEEASKVPENKSGTAASTAPASAAPLKIRIMNRVNAEVKIDDNPIFKEVEKLANVQLEYEAPPINNYVDKLQIVMASGDLPDIIYNWGGADANYDKWAKNELLATIDDKIAKYPNLSANITKEMWEAMRSVETGKIHAVPKSNLVNDWGYVVNQPWLDKLNIKAPNTLDEFYEVCKIFATKDPDGNGKADTYGFTFTGSSAGSNSIWNSSDYLTNAFDLSRTFGVKDVDGNYKIREKFEGYIPYMTFLRKMYTEKLLDPEFFTNKIYADEDKMNQDRIGIRYSHQVGVLGSLKKIPDAITKLTYHAPLTNKKGESICYVTPPIWGCYMISKNTKDLDGVLKFLDWGNSKEGFTLMQMGIKGVHYSDYDFEKRTVTRTEDQAKLLATVASSYTTLAFAFGGSSAIVENGDTPERIAKYNKDRDAAKKVIKEINLPAVKAPKLQNLVTTNPDDVKKKDEAEVKYIVGEMTEQQFRDFLTKEYFPKVDAAEKEYIEVMKKMGK